MAEKKSLFRRIFSFASATEEERVPEHGEAPRPSDVEMGVVPGEPDPDLHQPALADSVADTEAGGGPDQGGGITPLKETEASSGSSAARPAPPSPPATRPGTAEKKTLK